VVTDIRGVINQSRQHLRRRPSLTCQSVR